MSGPLHNARLLSFVPGETLNKVPWNPEFGRQAGRHLAKIDEILSVSRIESFRLHPIPL